MLVEEDRCVRCGRWMSTDVPYRDAAGKVDPRSASVDHVVALAEGGALLDRSNVRLAHLGCNARAGGELGLARLLGAA